MNEKSYCFGDFRLRTKSRELLKAGQVIPLPASAFDLLSYLLSERDRPVGRDELIAAVWGRADVSDGLLAQIIVRLRRTLGDDNKSPKYIRTVPRVGYRWVAETVEEGNDELPSNGVDALNPPIIHIQGTRLSAAFFKVMRKPSAFIFIGGLIASCGAILSIRSSTKIDAMDTRLQHTHTTPVAAILPAFVSAPNEWRWLGLGTMALVSEQVRSRNTPVMASADVLELINDNPHTRPAALLKNKQLGISYVVQPAVSFNQGVWSVRLSIEQPNGQSDEVHASGADVLAAAHTATDLLLVKIGEAPSSRAAAVGSEVEMLYQQVNAARLAGHPDVARALLSGAPDSFRSWPLIRFTAALLDCEIEVDRARCKSALQSALLSAQADKSNPELQARVLVELGRQNLFDDPIQNDRFLDAAKHLLDASGDQGDLAFAYLSLGYDAYVRWDLARAADTTARARAGFEAVNDAMGLARADFQDGLIADRRGQMDVSLAKLEAAEKKFARLGTKSMLPVTWDALASVQSSRLQFANELSVTDRFWPVAEGTTVASKLELYLARSTALLDNGRVAEAEALLSHISSDSASAKLTGIAAYATVLRAKIAFDRGDMFGASLEANRAMTLGLIGADRRQYASTWLLYIRAQRLSGNSSKAADETRKLAAWAASAANSDEWLSVYSGLAIAEQRVFDGKSDEALQTYESVLSDAERFGPPDLIVDTAVSYLNFALALRRENLALRLSGTLANWSKTDMRAAYAVGMVARATHNSKLYVQSMEDARSLAGERFVRENAPWSASHR